MLRNGTTSHLAMFPFLNPVRVTLGIIPRTILSTLCSLAIPPKTTHQLVPPVSQFFRMGTFKTKERMGLFTFFFFGTHAEWSAGFPAPGTIQGLSKVTEPWINALNAALAAGKIRNIPVSTSVNQSTPVYPNGTDPTSPDICSGSYQCAIPGDIWNGPDGIFASSFDDGPTDVSLFLSIFFFFSSDTILICDRYSTN